MMSLTRPLCILIKGTHFLRGNPEGTHVELKGNPVIRLIPMNIDYLSVSKQLKVESELKFSYPGNERYYKFNLEVLDHLENFSKALLVQDSAKASLLLNDSIKLMKKT